MARLAADHPRNMAPPGGVFGKHHVARSEAANRDVAGLDLHLAGKRDYILALGHRMKVAQMVRRRRAKDDSMSWLEGGSLDTAGDVQFDIDVFEVRFVIGAG